MMEIISIEKNQKKARDKYIAHRKMSNILGFNFHINDFQVSGLDGLKKGKSSFSSSFNAKSSNRRSVGSQDSLTQGLNDSSSGLKMFQPDLAKLEEEKPGEAESPQQDPYPVEFPAKRNFSRSTTEPNLFKRRSKLPLVNAKRASDLPRPSPIISQLEVDFSGPPSGALTQTNLEVSPIFKNMKSGGGNSGSRSSTPQLKSSSPQILKVANLLQKKKEGAVKILPFSPVKSTGFIQKEPAKARSKITSIKLEVGKGGAVHSFVKVPPLNKTPTGAENQKRLGTCSSIQLKTEQTDEGGMTRTLEFLVPTTVVVSPKDSKVHSGHATTSTSYKSLSKILKKSQERAINVYTKDKLLIQEKESAKKANLKYQSHSHIQRGNQKSLSPFPNAHIPKLNIMESRMTSPQKKAQTLIPIKFKDEKERIKANEKKATWLIGNFGGTKKNFIMKSFCLDQTSLTELKINKKRNVHGI